MLPAIGIGRGRAEVFVDAERSDLPGIADRRLRTIGERFATLAQCQQQFFGELRGCLQALDADVTEGSRARLQGTVRSALEVLGWCDAVHAEIATESGRIAGGKTPIDVRDLCERAARSSGLAPGSVHVMGDAPLAWWGDEGKLAELVRLAIALIAERTAAAGPIVIEVATAEQGPTIRIAGAGDAVEEPSPSLVRQFRQIVDWAGVAVAPDRLGPAVPAIVLELPLEA